MMMRKYLQEPDSGTKTPNEDPNRSGPDPREQRVPKRAAAEAAADWDVAVSAVAVEKKIAVGNDAVAAAAAAT